MSRLDRADEPFSMVYFLVVGGVLCGWTFLRVLGGERERRIQEIQAQISVEVTRAAEEAARQGREF